MTTIVFGLDGANWSMLEEWMAAGDLPTLHQLKEEGFDGVSRSVLPPLTVPNWACYATGKNPGKFGVFRFDRIDTSRRKHVFHNATDIHSPRVWDYLNDEGLQAGVINLPSTYPPGQLNGFIVAGGPDASESTYRSLEEGYTWPPSLEKYLRRDLDYRVHPSPMISPADRGEAEVEAILDLIDLRFDAAEALLERESPDFLHCTVFYNMALQHYFWREEPVRRAWKRIDANLERFVGEGHDLVIMSDHGTNHIDAVFYINVWLAEHGYLQISGGVDQWLRRAGVTRERALAAAKRLNLVEPLRRLTPEQLQRMLPWEEGIKRDRVLSVIDWEETSAVASNQGPIYLNVGDTEYEPLREELIDRLSGLEHPETGDRLIKEVHRGEQYYHGSHVAEAPDLLLHQSDHVYVSDAIGPDEWIGDEGAWVGGNMPDGIVLWHGPGFRTGTFEDPIDIVDIMPTILHSMGASVPTDLDGSVLDVFSPGNDRGPEHATYREPIQATDQVGKTADDVEQRLVDLGYLE